MQMLSTQPIVRVYKKNSCVMIPNNSRYLLGIVVIIGSLIPLLIPCKSQVQHAKMLKKPIMVYSTLWSAFHQMESLKAYPWNQ